MATEPRAAASRRTWVLLGFLVVVALGAVVLKWGSSPPAAGPAATSNTQRPGSSAATTGAPAAELDVKLDTLSAPREEPAAIERNPFRFEAARRPQAEGSARASRPPVRPDPEPAPQPSGPPPPPPIPLKFIGIIESPQAGRVAALSDGRRVFHGRVGDIIEGRYRIVRIGVESIVLEYADGSGPQQTIRLSGQ